MRRVLCVALLCAVGCSSVPVAEPVHADQKSKEGIEYWMPNVMRDLYETVDARVGVDYGFGAHVKATDLARIGVFDYSDFTVLGITKNIMHGHWALPNMEAWNGNGSWDMGVKVGIGFGADATVHTWEVFDLASSVIGFGYWSLDKD